MIIKIKGIYLHTGFKSNGTDCFDAIVWMRENLGRENFTHLGYNEPDQYPEVFTSIKTWFADDPDAVFDSFPFITYDEVDSDFNFTRRYIIGFDNIKNSTLPQLIKL